MPISRHPLMSASAARGIHTDDDLADRLEKSAALFGDLSKRLVPRFYERLFARAPGVRKLFPADPVAMDLQRDKLAASLRAVVAHLRRPEVLYGPLRDLGRRHEGYGAKPEHYPIVIEELVGAMRDVAGKDWTAEHTADWTTALTLVADVMLGKA
jgi:methyl-accepting chemotaxis protein